MKAQTLINLPDLKISVLQAISLKGLQKAFQPLNAGRDILQNISSFYNSEGELKIYVHQTTGFYL